MSVHLVACLIVNCTWYLTSHSNNGGPAKSTYSQMAGSKCDRKCFFRFSEVFVRVFWLERVGGGVLVGGGGAGREISEPLLSDFFSAVLFFSKV